MSFDHHQFSSRAGDARNTAPGLAYNLVDAPPPPRSGLLWRQTPYGRWLLARLAAFEGFRGSSKSRSIAWRATRDEIDALDSEDAAIRRRIAASKNVHLLKWKDHR